jgi:hypothetical protein
MTVQATHWPNLNATTAEGDGALAIPADLHRAARREMAPREAFQILAFYQDEHAREAADLLERETWALMAILASSNPIWNHRDSPTLRFMLDCSSTPLSSHVELGRFAHLAALAAPNADEQALIETTTCCFARVAPHPERHGAGEVGALACSYIPISVGEAISLLGFGQIMDQIEATTRQTGEMLLTQARLLGERQTRLLGAERMLGWEPDPAAAPHWATTACAWLLVAVLGPDCRVRLIVGLVFLGIVAVLSGLIN